MDEVKEVIDPIAAMLTLEEMELRRKQRLWRDSREAVLPIVSAMVEIGAEPVMCANDVTFRLTGGKGKLVKAIRILRTGGYNSYSTKPRAGDTTWMGKFERPDSLNLWLQFTSTACRRVQVGTKLQEVPVYEVVCGDDLEQIERQVPEIEGSLF